jgi:hypothetical protein
MPAASSSRVDGVVEAPVDAPGGLRRDRLVVAGLTALLALPLLVALGALRRPTWVPVLDLVMTELRVRDVGGRHTPLIGLPGRIGTLEQQGSHPGPISFWLLAPTYRLFGSSAWALQVGAALLNIVAMGVALALARRRGGLPVVAAVGALLALLTVGYGAGALVEPWNPYLPMMWWVVLMLAVWSVLAGDALAFPVAVVAATFCAQTHVPYLPLGLGMGALAVAGLVLAWRSGTPATRRTALRWGAVGVGLGVVLWIPPTIDQVVNDPGNYRQLVDHFGSPPEDEEVVGLGTAMEVVASHLDLAHLSVDQVADPSTLVLVRQPRDPSAARGVVVGVLWVASVAAAVALRDRALIALHAVVAAGLLAAVVAVSRVFGKVWYYLTLWVWGLAALMALAVGLTVAAVLTRRLAAVDRARAGRVTVAVLVAVAVLAAGRHVTRAPSVEPSDHTVSRAVAVLVPELVAALDEGEVPGGGRDGRYLIGFDDALHFGSQSYSLLSELERAGFDAGVPPFRSVPATPHRVLEPEEATARVQLVSGIFIERWREIDDAVEVATADLRTPEEVREYEALRSEVLELLDEADLPDVAAQVDTNLFGAAIDVRVPERAEDAMARMLELGGPTSIFVAPIEVNPILLPPADRAP